MSQKIQFRRGSFSEVGSTVFDQGEPIWIIDRQKLYIGDGVTPGGVLWNVENPIYMSGTIANAVYTTGNQIISGVKRFEGLISGRDISNNPYIYDIKNGTFYYGGTGTNQISLSLGGRSLSYNDIESLNWEFDEMRDENGILSIRWGVTRDMIDSNIIPTLKWNDKLLTGGTWNTNGLQINDNLNIKISNKSFIFTGFSPSYSNYLGTGQRSGLVNLSTNISFNGNITGLVNGIQNESVLYFTTPQSGSGTYLKFDFNVPKVITEATWHQDLTSSHGTVSWYGSNDNTNLTNISNRFTLGGATSQTHTGLANNTNPYRYYILSGTSGQFSSSPYLREVEFKIIDEVNVPYLFSNGKILAGSVPNPNFVPTAKLHLSSGETGVYTAPLKFTSGRLQANPERGAVEYANNNLYFTNDTGRKIVPMVTNPPAAFNSPGLSGNIAFDSDYMYVCTANNSWKRTLLEVW